MPNLGSVLKAEISRLSRKQVRSEIAATKTATTQHRKHIADLRRQLSELRRELGELRKVAARASASAPSQPEKRHRFSAKGLRSHRQRLGLSADDYGRLVGVSGQSIYNWEHESAVPREAQKARLLAIRAVGARKARAFLEQLDAQS